MQRCGGEWESGKDEAATGGRYGLSVGLVIRIYDIGLMLMLLMVG